MLPHSMRVQSSEYGRHNTTTPHLILRRESRWLSHSRTFYSELYVRRESRPYRLPKKRDSLPITLGSTVWKGRKSATIVHIQDLGLITTEMTGGSTREMDNKLDPSQGPIVV